VKKKRGGIIAAILLTIILLIVLVADEHLTVRAEAAEQEQQQVHTAYQNMLSNAEAAAVTVTEGGNLVDTYSLEQLGLLQNVNEAIDLQFGHWEQMTPEAYAKLSVWEKLEWFGVPHPENPELKPDVALLRTGCVWEDLNAVPRQAAADAVPYYDNGAFLTKPEEAGTMLIEAPVNEAVLQAASTLVIAADRTSTASVELTDYDCYVPPVVTTENAKFDYPALLQQQVEGKTLTLQFVDQTVMLDSTALLQLLTVDPNGVISLREEPAAEQIAAWAETYDKTRTPYLFNSYMAGYVPISFLKVDYTLDQELLLRQLQTQLPKLDMTPIEAPMVCRTYKGEVFDMGDTYVEVDIKHQTMTYFKDGELVVSTDVVTGLPDGHMTPRGHYNIYNKDTDCWLIGADYCVFVEYWVGIWDVYGIHDASWRSKFGGKYYLTNGSHGCVNTPTEPMELIHRTIEIGTPVLIF